MATTITSIDASIKNLAVPFQTAIKTQIESESAPLKRIQVLKDSIEVRKGVYTDVKTNLDALQSAMQALISSQSTYGLTSTSKSSVVPATSGSTVLTISKTSETAAATDYDFYVSKLAKAHSRATAAAASPDIALNKSGTFWMGGTGTANLQTETEPGVYADFVASTSLTAASAISAATGQKELGTGTYTLQVRDSSSVRQFRLVDADGNAVSIRKSDGSTGYTSEWQTMNDGVFDTGRGQSLTLNKSGGLETTSFYYTAKGTSISISTSDTQRSIVASINAALQPEGHDFRASIVSNQLVLTSSQTGANHSMIYTDGASLGFNTLLQSAQNAEFTVNGMNVSRASNANLTDVVDGLTINLAGDAEGKSARLSVTANNDKALGLMNALVTKFNASITHLKDKMASTSKTENGKTTYTRGPLSGETVFSNFRSDMLYRMSRSYTNTGNYKRLEEVGLSFDKDMKLTLDSTKFSDAIKNNKADVTALLDAGMGEMNTMLSRYTGTSGLLTKSLSSFETQSKDYDQRIAKYNASLEIRKQSLYNQYIEYQAQLVDLGNTATMFGINLGSNVNTSG
ncbi:MAG: flagellar filament capping protein FliD [Anaerolineales bacterium]|uniref:flagellar filament capping protein FliD n=1 Tax=Candidatus Villigracilis vicinus TaxID=3140679 RepID=UPI003137210A|nr:flagellar filament capping protein FliD [Anaerolineales bacterium]